MKRFLAGWLVTASIFMLGGCGGDDTQPLVKDPVVNPTHVDLTPGCNPMATSEECMFPFPSGFVETADASSPTGVRLNLDGAKLPLKDGVDPLDMAPYNTADGFSPLMPILMHFGFDIDVSTLPSQYELDRSVEDGSTIAVFNMDTGKRVMYFAEMDQNLRDGYDGRYAFVIRPMEPLEMGSRTLIVIKRDIRAANGEAIESPPAFAALRDDVLTDNADVEAMRGDYDEIFTFLADHGYAREDVLLAWDYRVASEDYLLGSVLSMREEAFAAAGTQGLPYTITNIADNPNPNIARIVEGDFEVPTFLRADDTFEYDADHHPIRQQENRKYPFTMLLPKKSEMGPLPLIVLGHGIFGNGRDFLTGSGDGAAIQQLANDFGAVVIATDWIGLSSNDLPRIASEIAPDLNRIGLITDQLQQSLVNNLVMVRLARGALKDDPQVKFPTVELLDLSRTFYWGASLGGIQGSSFISLSDLIARAAFGVPGSAWATMISRSVVFPPLRTFIEPHYPDPLDFTFGVVLLQARFDHSDPANLTKLMFEKPLADAPPNRMVILQEAIGDAQVPNMTTDILARAMGVKLLTPSIYPVFGIPEATAPTTDSVVVHYQLADYNNPLPPDGNIPPDKDNGVHHAMNFLPNVHQQIADLFFDGTVNLYCTGTCDPD